VFSLVGRPACPSIAITPNGDRVGQAKEIRPQKHFEKCLLL
jgi:hypothetical protein